MKQTIFLITLVVLFSACSNKKEDQGQKKLDIARRMNQAFETGNISLLDDIISADFIDHREMGDVKGIDSLKAQIKAAHQSVKQLKADVLQQAANNEFVFSWIHFKGSGTGTTAEGNSTSDFEVNGVHIFKLKDNKISERWEYMDIRDVSKMVSTSEMPSPAE